MDNTQPLIFYQIVNKTLNANNKRSYYFNCFVSLILQKYGHLLIIRRTIS